MICSLSGELPLYGTIPENTAKKEGEIENVPESRPLVTVAGCDTTRTHSTHRHKLLAVLGLGENSNRK